MPSSTASVSFRKTCSTWVVATCEVDSRFDFDRLHRQRTRKGDRAGPLRTTPARAGNNYALGRRIRGKKEQKEIESRNRRGLTGRMMTSNGFLADLVHSMPLKERRRARFLRERHYGFQRRGAYWVSERQIRLLFNTAPGAGGCVSLLLSRK